MVVPVPFPSLTPMLPALYALSLVTAKVICFWSFVQVPAKPIKSQLFPRSKMDVGPVFEKGGD